MASFSRKLAKVQIFTSGCGIIATVAAVAVGSYRREGQANDGSFATGRLDMRILIVEDHEDLSVELAEQMARSGLAADCAVTLKQARELLSEQKYALALLDRRMPDGDGVSLVPAIRAVNSSTRILMLTAFDAEDDKISGLDAGADDYLTKPFNPSELMARIRANLRRLGADGCDPTIRLANLSFTPSSREVAISGRSIALQRRERDLLEALMRRAGRMVTRDRLLEEVYGGNDDLHWNNLNVLVSQMRRRLKAHGAEVEIHTTRGVGYFIAKSASCS
jgi:DNA-binding response OmpR family regulator